MFENRTDKIYFKTNGGQFYREVPEGTPDAQTRIAEKTGRKITYLAYNRITGFITGIQYRKHEHEGKVYRSVCIDMQSKSGEWRIELNVFTNAARCFFHVMESIDPALECQFDIKRSGERDSLFVAQPDGTGRMEALKWNYTKDNPGERPEWVEKVNKFGEKEWDNTAEIAWFLEKVPGVNERFTGNWATAPATMPAASPVNDMDIPEMLPATSEEPPVTDDLPF